MGIGEKTEVCWIDWNILLFFLNTGWKRQEWAQIGLFKPMSLSSFTFPFSLAKFCLFQPSIAYSSLFQHISVYSNLFQPIPAYFSIIQLIPANSNQFWPIPNIQSPIPNPESPIYNLKCPIVHFIPNWKFCLLVL